MEVTGIALQTVAAGEDVAFTETPVCGSKCIVHRQGSGIIKLRGITNQCKARFLVSYSGNIQIPTGGTVEAISLAIAVDGEPLQSTRMIVPHYLLYKLLRTASHHLKNVNWVHSSSPPLL
jgi:hypothetical protein